LLLVLYNDSCFSVLTGKLGTDEVVQGNLNSNRDGEKIDACTNTLLADVIDKSTDTTVDAVTSSTSDRCSAGPTRVQDAIEEEADSLGDVTDKSVFKPPSPLVQASQPSVSTEPNLL